MGVGDHSEAPALAARVTHSAHASTAQAVPATKLLPCLLTLVKPAVRAWTLAGHHEKALLGGHPPPSMEKGDI